MAGDESSRCARCANLAGLVMAWIIVAATTGPARGQILPEQLCIPGRPPETLPQLPTPDIGPPRTVAAPGNDLAAAYLSLDEAISIALENSEVIRVLTGVSASASGQTIYDPAIATPAIDEARSIFDPQVTLNNTFTRIEPPIAAPAPGGATFSGIRTDGYDLSLDVTKQNVTGGTAGLSVITDRNRTRPRISLLNPQTTSGVELSYVQPLLRGRGADANLAPIVLARIDAERSYFQMKDSVQELVRGVIDAYWGLVFARTDYWARRQQVEQGQFAFERTQAEQEFGRADLADVAQTRVAFATFRANLIAAEANLIAQEAALRNILGIPPTDDRRLVPTTPPSSQQLDFAWETLLVLAQEQRPDIIELKLILEADQQQLILAQNRAQPQLDAVALYRWNGLEGEVPSGAHVASPDGTSTDWTLGVSFSVPLGLRESRAQLRRQDLILTRDTANLNQQLHAMTHTLAANLRNLAQFYAQYDAFRITREAARVNLEAQIAEFVLGRTDFLNVLQAITDWGNAVSNEASSLTQYNAELANLERQTGTILEAHGVRFFEERFRSIGPLGRLGHGRAYPRALPPTDNVPRYPSGDAPAEESFQLDDPMEGVRRLRIEEVPTP